MPKIIENVREQLLSEAKRQIAERGYAKTTIRSVAGECGLAVGTVYNYFPSKDMLIATFMLEEWRECLEGIADHSGEDVYAILKSMYDALRQFSARHTALFNDSDAAKVFATAFAHRHKQLRGQLADIIRTACGVTEFEAEFVAEALLTWTMAGTDFDDIASVLMKIIKK